MWRIKMWFEELENKIYCKEMKRKYPDWEDNEYNCNSLKFIWAVKSWDDFTSRDANMHTMNDIEIDYDRETEEYTLSIETVYQFKQGKIGEVKYLEDLLNAFTKFMVDNNYDTDEPLFFWTLTDDLWRAKSISQLYTQFRVFVEGYKAVYGADESVKHSKWEISFDGYYPYCVECGYEPGRDKLTDFCPKCGARMDGDKNA